MSRADASPMLTGVPIAVASVVISFGAISSGFVVSVIVIFCSAIVAFPFSSVTVHVTVVVFTGYVAGASFLTVTL